MNSCPDNQRLFDYRKRKEFEILEQLPYIYFTSDPVSTDWSLTEIQSYVVEALF